MLEAESPHRLAGLNETAESKKGSELFFATLNSSDPFFDVTPFSTPFSTLRQETQSADGGVHRHRPIVNIQTFVTAAPRGPPPR